MTVIVMITLLYILPDVPTVTADFPAPTIQNSFEHADKAPSLLQLHAGSSSEVQRASWAPASQACSKELGAT
jgi:hypothetical protein